MKQHCCTCTCGELSDPTVDTPGAYHGPQSKAPDTERLAALQAMPSTGSRRAEVLEAFVRRGRRGLTDYELRHYMHQHTGGPQARRHELKLGGWVVDSGRRRITAHGGMAAVWVLSDKGKERLR